MSSLQKDRHMTIRLSTVAIVLALSAVACKAPDSSTAPPARATGAPAAGAAPSADSGRFDALANAAFAENRPTAETARMLRDELLFQRATQTYLWACR